MENENEIIDRIRKIIELNSDTPTEFANKIDFNQSNLSKILKGNRRVPSNLLTKISKELHIKLSWLLTGNGEMYSKEVIEIQTNTIVNIPLVSQYAYAGYLTGYGDNEYLASLPSINFTPDREMTGKYLAFEVRGDSMNDESLPYNSTYGIRDSLKLFWRIGKERISFLLFFLLSIPFLSFPILQGFGCTLVVLWLYFGCTLVVL